MLYKGDRDQIVLARTNLATENCCKETVRRVGAKHSNTHNIL